MWGSAKWGNKQQRGTSRHHLDTYLPEFIWPEKKKRETPFDAILKAIS
ncbi:hypothetical protein X975_09888, partial [Stegodyphus mimosarum]